MAQERLYEVVEPAATRLLGLSGLQVHVIEQLMRAAALKQVMLERDSGEPTLRLVDAVLAARYRDCVEQCVETAADAILAYVRSPAAALAPGAA